MFYSDAEYVRRHEGEKALQAIEQELQKMGYPINYSKIQKLGWYPIGLRALSLLAIKGALNWDDEQIKEMGRNAPKYSLITRLMLRYLAHPETVVSELETYWRKNYSVGSLKGAITDHSAILHLGDFLIHPVLCTYLQGYFVGVLSLTIGQTEELGIKETKCMHWGGECHEFVLQW